MTAPQRPLPGDLSAEEAIARMIRVDHAGEYGARRIYEGQLAATRDVESRRLITHMLEQEKAHLARFEKLILERRVRPTALAPLWHMAGFALGAATALMGPRAAMACTAAVEEVIDEHYAAQQAQLGPEEAGLSATLEQFRQEELEHRETALAAGADDAPLSPLLQTAIRGATKLAIWLSTRI